MKALQITRYDGTNGLRYQDATPPAPGPGSVAVDLDYAGVGYVETLFAAGFVERPVPWTPGLEGAGRVSALGADVTGVRLGDHVAALTVNGGGAYGQVAVTRAELVAPLPEGMDPALAAVVPSNTTTALLTMERVAQLHPGEEVLVHAAAGGLGSQMVQVARHLGASRVVGVVGSETKRGTAADLGCDEVWLRTDLPEHSREHFDVIVDPVSGPSRVLSQGMLRLGGRMLVVGDSAQAGDQPLSSNALWFGGTAVLGFNLGATASADPALVGSYLRRAIDLVSSGQVVVHLVERVPIQDGARVLADLSRGRTVGKTVLVHEPH